MTKKDRELVFNKFGGKCAYCGCGLGKGWHVDELEPCRRIHKWDSVNRRWQYVGMAHPERVHIDNQNPSCPSCNINKHSMSLEEFRESISKYINSLNQYSTQYKIAKRYGLVQETAKPVVFYFETYSS